MDEELDLYFKIQHVQMQIAYHESMKEGMKKKLEELQNEYQEKFGFNEKPTDLK